MSFIQDYKDQQRRRESVVKIVSERGYDNIISQIAMDNYKGWHRKDTKFLDAVREEYQND